jgi:hypothetical protein
MDKSIKEAIECLAKRINKDSTPDEALKFTQAACNLANTLATLAHGKLM